MFTKDLRMSKTIIYNSNVTKINGLCSKFIVHGNAHLFNVAIWYCTLLDAFFLSFIFRAGVINRSYIIYYTESHNQK